jgi:hypothetical protein
MGEPRDAPDVGAVGDEEVSSPPEDDPSADLQRSIRAIRLRATLDRRRYKGVPDPPSDDPGTEGPVRDPVDDAE